MKYVCHNIHLETAFNYKEDNNCLTGAFLTKITNKKLKVKLEPHRNYAIAVSDTGTVDTLLNARLIHMNFILLIKTW